MANQLFEQYAIGTHTISTLRKFLKIEYGMTMSVGNIHLIPRNKFYIGIFEWVRETFTGKYPLFVNPKTFARAQEILAEHNRSRYSKRDVAFRGLITCAYDGCQLTGDVQTGKYVYYYYRCTGYHGKCDLPRLREETSVIDWASP